MTNDWAHAVFPKFYFGVKFGAFFQIGRGKSLNWQHCSINHLNIQCILLGGICFIQVYPLFSKYNLMVCNKIF